MTDDVDGIGEEQSRDLAREFESVNELRVADADDFKRVAGIGAKRARRWVEEIE